MTLPQALADFWGGVPVVEKGRGVIENNDSSTL
jgi:hypothetical protein